MEMERRNGERSGREQIPEAQAAEEDSGIIPRLESIRLKLADLDRIDSADDVRADEIERAILERVGTYQRSIFRSMIALCSSVLVNTREIERLNRIVDSLPAAKERRGDIDLIVARVDGARGSDALSPREKDILSQLLGGLSNKEISATLGISDKTVKNHLWKIYRKLGVENRTQLFHLLIT
jgi:DNA-binding NarL/FixJ family response regulator